MTEEQIQDLLKNFEHAFRENIAKAYACGALAGDELPYVVGKAVLLITAEGFAPWPEKHEYKRMLSNLRYFV